MRRLDTGSLPPNLCGRRARTALALTLTLTLALALTRALTLTLALALARTPRLCRREGGPSQGGAPKGGPCP